MTGNSLLYKIKEFSTLSKNNFFFLVRIVISNQWYIHKTEKNLKKIEVRFLGFPSSKHMEIVESETILTALN
jgi:hypothetical protein